MKRLIDQFFTFIERHSWAQGISGLIGAILFLIIIALFLIWLTSPIDIIYDPNAIRFPCSLGGCD